MSNITSFTQLTQKLQSLTPSSSSLNTAPSDSTRNIILRCPFKSCNCRVIAYPYPFTTSSQSESSMLNDALYSVKQAPECIQLHSESLEVINPKLESNRDNKDKDQLQQDTIRKESNNEEKQQQFFKVNDAWDFDNIGVSRPTDIQQPTIVKSGLPVDIAATVAAANDKDGEKLIVSPTKINIQRYLVCADCERGPIGFAGFASDGSEDKLQEAESQDERINKANQLVYFLSANSIRYELR